MLGVCKNENQIRMQRKHRLFSGVRLFKGPVLVSVGMYPKVVKNPSSVQVSMEENYVESKLTLRQRILRCAYSNTNTCQKENVRGC